MFIIKTKADFDWIVEEIGKKIEEYENNPLAHNKYTLRLANGEKIRYSINESNIAHLLGVNTTYLEGIMGLRDSNSYDTLKKLVDNPYPFYTKLSNNKSFTTAFSDHIDDKFKAFSTQFEIPFWDNIEFICKYDRNRNYSLEKGEGYKEDYYIAKKNTDGDIVLLGLVKREKYEADQVCIAQTSRIISYDENMDDNLGKLLKFQEITYATNLDINNESNRYENSVYLNTMYTKKILHNLKIYREMYDAFPVTLDAHIYATRYMGRSKERAKEDQTILDRIKESVKTNKIIETSEDTEVLDEAIKVLINSHNDFMIATSNVDSATKGRFSEVKEERDSLRKELESMKAEVQSLKEQKESQSSYYLEKAIALEELGNSSSELIKKLLKLSEEVQKGL